SFWRVLFFRGGHIEPEDSRGESRRRRIYAFVLAFFWTVLRVPALAQILPLGIHGHNECQLLNPKQPFDLLFTLDGGGHADEALVVDEAVNPVAGSKSGKRPGLVLEHAIAEIAGYPGVAFASDWS